MTYASHGSNRQRLALSQSGERNTRFCHAALAQSQVQARCRTGAAEPGRIAAGGTLPVLAHPVGSLSCKTVSEGPSLVDLVGHVLSAQPYVNGRTARWMFWT